MRRFSFVARLVALRVFRPGLFASRLWSPWCVARCGWSLWGGSVGPFVSGSVLVFGRVDRLDALESALVWLFRGALAREVLSR